MLPSVCNKSHAFVFFMKKKKFCWNSHIFECPFFASWNRRQWVERGRNASLAISGERQHTILITPQIWKHLGEVLALNKKDYSILEMQVLPETKASLCKWTSYDGEPSPKGTIFCRSHSFSRGIFHLSYVYLSLGQALNVHVPTLKSKSRIVK